MALGAGQKILLGIIIILLIGFSYLIFTTIPYVPLEKKPEPTIEYKTTPAPSKNLSQLSLECDKNLSIALGKKDASLCNSIECGDTQNYCLAVITKDVAYCSKMIFGKENCLSFLVLQTKNSVVCNSLYGDDKIRCLIIVSKNFSLCNNFSLADYKNSCLRNAFIETGNKSFCEAITDLVFKEDCLSRG